MFFLTICPKARLKQSYLIDNTPSRESSATYFALACAAKHSSGLEEDWEALRDVWTVALQWLRRRVFVSMTVNVSTFGIVRKCFEVSFS